MPGVLLDRDGVINQHRHDYVTSWEKFRFLPRALAALAAMRQAGFRVAVVTNQSAVGRGLMAREALDHIHLQMLDQCRNAGGAIDAVFACVHAPWDACACRKPRPGMIIDAITSLRERPETCVLVGDSATDMRAARTAGVPFVLVRTGQGEETLAHVRRNGLRPDRVVDDLWDAFLAVRQWFADGERLAA